jgi:hypothetical protein
MATRLEQFSVKQDRGYIRAGIMECNGDRGYHIVDSREKGRIMFTHSCEDGFFRLGENRVKDIFYETGCNSLVCCYPAQQYKRHPELAKELDILYPECDIQVYSDTTIPHIMSIGSCVDYWDMDEDEKVLIRPEPWGSEERRCVMTVEKWELQKVNNMACTMDVSGIYTLISRAAADKEWQDKGVYILVRLDIMRETDDLPLQSFVGLGNDVRKHCIKWIEDNGYEISSEHSSYIGYELCRAMVDEHYVQD